jgi:hypothetical protein
MTASNHAVAGAVIASVVANPVIAIPLAFASHFVMDAMPHYGDRNKSSWLNRNFHYVLVSDFIVTLSFISFTIFKSPPNLFMIFICAVVAVLPDVLWLPYYLADIRHKDCPHSKTARFLKWIQWGERPWGIVIEIGVFILLVHTFIKQIS